MSDDVNTIYGGSSDDTLTGTDNADDIWGKEGDDTIYGGAGEDTITGGAGDDTLTGGAGDDVFTYIDGESGDDIITDFTSGEDVIFLHKLPGILSFDDLTITQDGDNAVIDLTDHGGGSITLQNVTATDLSADDFQFELTGTSGDDTIQGAAHDDALYGGEGDDTIDGGAGDDHITGDAGADTITGGAGDDDLSGNEGADIFVFAAGHGDDKIRDFTDGEDAIDLTAITAITGFENLTITTEDVDTIIDLTAHGGGTIRLENFDSANLDAEDFIFYEVPTTNDDGSVEAV